MVSSTYHITEPHPSVPASHYIHSGRGGIGNISHVDPKTLTSGADATGPASVTVLKGSTVRPTASSASSSPNSTTPYYATGRGGVGNMHHTQERPIFSFDEELERQRKMMEHQAPVYHVGRGGAGNFANDAYPARSQRSSAASQASSGHGSVRGSFEGTWNRVRTSFAK
jgi:hypothetical protein